MENRKIHTTSVVRTTDAVQNQLGEPLIEMGLTLSEPTGLQMNLALNRKHKTDHGGIDEINVIMNEMRFGINVTTIQDPYRTE